jgi:hypothetical protein
MSRRKEQAECSTLVTQSYTDVALMLHEPPKLFEIEQKILQCVHDRMITC